MFSITHVDSKVVFLTTSRQSHIVDPLVPPRCSHCYRCKLHTLQQLCF